MHAKPRCARLTQVCGLLLGDVGQKTPCSCSPSAWAERGSLGAAINMWLQTQHAPQLVLQIAGGCCCKRLSMKGSSSYFLKVQSTLAGAACRLIHKGAHTDSIQA